MPSPSERIVLLERELMKYNLKRSQNRTINTIKEDIVKRIKILSAAQTELMAISTELFYYNFVDHIGNAKIEKMSVQQCLVILKETKKAMIKFISDNDRNYIAKCSLLESRVIWVGYNLSKEALDKKEEISEFFSVCPEETKEKLRKAYYSKRKKEISKVLKECTENLEKNYQMVIAAEFLSYERTFKEKAMEENGEVNKSFDKYLKEILNGVLNKKNKNVAKSICLKIRSGKRMSREEQVFKEVVLEKYKEDLKMSVEL